MRNVQNAGIESYRSKEFGATNEITCLLEHVNYYMIVVSTMNVLVCNDRLTGFPNLNSVFRQCPHAEVIFVQNH